MIRKFNYTDRKRVPKECIIIELEYGSRPASFNARINLSEVDLPLNAKIYIEPYFKAASMRFCFGTVGNIHAPEDRTLSRIPQPELAYFRFKVVDESESFGRILAAADRLMPLVDTADRANQTCIFPVNVTETGNELWRLDMDDRPILQLNRDVERIKELAGSDFLFALFIYPSLIKQVLTKILIVEKHDDPDSDHSDWRCQWLQFAIKLIGERPPKPTQTEQRESEAWIERVADKFSAKHRLIEKFKKMRDKGAS